MLYLQNTTEAQALFIPRNIDTPEGDLWLVLRNTLDLTIPVRVTVLDLGISALYYDVALTLPEGMADGEYQYTLTAGGETLSEGLLYLGAIPRGAAPSGLRQFEHATTYKQFNG